MAETKTDQANEGREALLSLLEATLDATKEGLLVVDRNGKIVRSNRRFAEIWRMPAELVEGKDDSAMVQFAKDQLEKPAQFVNQVESAYADLEGEFSDILRFRDGRRIARTKQPYRISGVTAGTLWSFRDVTDERRAEEFRNEARKNAEFVSEASRRLAESLDFEETVQAIQGIVIPRLGDWSAIGIREGESGMRLVAFQIEPPAPAITDRIGNNTLLDLSAPSGIPNVIRTGKSFLCTHVTAEHLTTDGGRYPIVGTRDPETLAAVRKTGLCSFMIVPLSVRGKVIGAMSIGSTRPERVYGESELALAEEIGRRTAIAIDSAMLYRDALRTIQVREDFLSVASHELRTPLSPLRMQFEMAHLFAKSLPEGTPKRTELLELMEGAGLQMDRLLKLVETLLDVSRITAGRLKLHPERCDLVVLIGEVAKRFEPTLAKARCRLAIRGPDSLEGHWDRSRIDQVISNLLSNAVKFGAGRPVEIEVQSRAGEAHLTVRDNGPGIDETDLARIFERFERGTGAAGTQGFGLGLYICREIVGAHSGKIGVESAPGKGASFIVRLPIGGPTPS
ncbi:MAG: GAF domain-containing protein [Bdellovibrionales bacterium]|nr:GAF domain-containing protein [Bdellovibrionales bacterium]